MLEQNLKERFSVCSNIGLMKVRYWGNWTPPHCNRGWTSSNSLLSIPRRTLQNRNSQALWRCDIGGNWTNLEVTSQRVSILRFSLSTPACLPVPENLLSNWRWDVGDNQTSSICRWKFKFDCLQFSHSKPHTNFSKWFYELYTLYRLLSRVL